MSKAMTLTLQIPQTLGLRLDEVAQAAKRSKAHLTEDALRAFLADYDWQIEAINEGLANADAGRFVEHEKVVAWLESWGTSNELPPPR